MKNTNKNNPKRTQLGTIQSKNWDLIINASLFHINFIHTSYQINRRINPSTFPIGIIQEFTILIDRNTYHNKKVGSRIELGS